MNALLGLPTGAVAAQGAAGAPTDYTGYVQSSPDLMQEWSRVAPEFGGNMGAYGQFHWNTYGQNEGRQIPQAQGQVTAATPTSAANAFDAFRNSTGYQFRLNEGNDALNSAYAGAGTLRSGAAGKAFQRYNQDYASNEFGNYMGYLGNQQSVGLQAGSALAGVSQSYANNVTALNGQQGQNIANSAVAKANNTNSMIGGITSSFGNALGMYGQGQGWFK